MPINHHLMLADWRREINALYGRLRHEKDVNRAWHDFHSTRDYLFKEHAQSPLTDGERENFTNLRYFSYKPDLRTVARVKSIPKPQTYSVDLPQEGVMRFSEIGTIQFNLSGVPLQLHLYWIEGFGGGLYLPFRDATNGHETYSGGRYLYDSIKGADLGAGSESVLLDFNFAYNPSCAYNDRWVCPLSPAENRLSEAIRGGEKSFSP